MLDVWPSAYLPPVFDDIYCCVIVLKTSDPLITSPSPNQLSYFVPEVEQLLVYAMETTVLFTNSPSEV